MGKRSFWQSLRNNRWLASTGMLAAGALAVYGVWQIPSLNQYHMESLESPATDGNQDEDTENQDTENEDTNKNYTQENQGNNGFDLPRDTEDAGQQGEKEGEEQKDGESQQGQDVQEQQEETGTLQETEEDTSNVDDRTVKKAKQKKKTSTKKKENGDGTEQASVEVLSNPQSVLSEGNFDESAGLPWPIEGDVILNYDTEGVVYFQTLAQYKANPAIMIAGTEGDKVKASADGIVTDITKNEETGITVKMSVGNSYEIVYGQLQDIQICEGDQIKEGTVLGTLAEPTDYYVLEGPNLYFQILQDGTPVNPLLLLN